MFQSRLLSFPKSGRKNNSQNARFDRKTGGRKGGVVNSEARVSRNARRECTWNEDAPRFAAIGVAPSGASYAATTAVTSEGAGDGGKKKRSEKREVGWWWSEVNGVARGWSGDRRRPPRGRAASSPVFASSGSSAASAPPVSPKRFLSRGSFRWLSAVPHRRIRFRSNANLKICCVIVASLAIISGKILISEPWYEILFYGTIFVNFCRNESRILEKWEKREQREKKIQDR